MVLGWDWFSSQGLRFLPARPRDRRRTPGPPFHPASARRPFMSARLGADQSWSLPSHSTRDGALGAQPDNRRFRWQAVLDAAPLGRHSGMSKQRDPLGALELAAAYHQHQLRRAHPHASLAPPPPLPHFADGTALLIDGTELQLPSLRSVDTTITLEGQEHPAFAALKDEFADPGPAFRRTA